MVFCSYSDHNTSKMKNMFFLIRSGFYIGFRFQLVLYYIRPGNQFIFWKIVLYIARYAHGILWGCNVWSREFQLKWKFRDFRVSYIKRYAWGGGNYATGAAAQVIATWRPPPIMLAFASLAHLANEMEKHRGPYMYFLSHCWAVRSISELHHDRVPPVS